MGKDKARDRDASLGSTRQSLPIMLLRARESVMGRFRPMLKDHGVTEQQWRVLRVLYEEGEVDVTFIARNAAILAPSLTRILKSLRENGLVAIRRDASDARRSLASLTPAGQTLVETVMPDSARTYEGISADFGAERMARLIEELDALIAALDDPRRDAE